MKSNKKVYIKKNYLLHLKKKKILQCNTFIVTVPTPIKKNKKPDLKYLKQASQIVGRVIKKADVVIYESTVYPGVTEDICVPIVEKFSKLKLTFLIFFLIFL